jgi:hypothetical protein
MKIPRWLHAAVDLGESHSLPHNLQKKMKPLGTSVFSWPGCSPLPRSTARLSELRLLPRLKLKDSCPPSLKTQKQIWISISPQELLLRKIYVLSYSSYSRWPPLHNCLTQRQPVDLHEETRTAHECLDTASIGQIAGIQILLLLELAQMFGLQNWEKSLLV